jgi:DNA-binding SARP family transcriptional activator
MLERGGQAAVSYESTGPPMLQLRTFGGLTLARGEEDLTGAATQRRRLAILALLAVARDTGFSRDKLVAYLWPESDAERARHVLNQLLYAQRRQFGEDGLFLGRKTLRLNAALIWTDVSGFEQALDDGAIQDGIALYRGPFLDGFFLKEAPEFERWVEEQRDRLARRMASALATLAQRATTAGDHRMAADWWRRAGEIDRYDSTLALALVQSLAAAGDRAGALLAGRRHEQMLQEELGVTPDQSFTEALRRLRRDPDQ